MRERMLQTLSLASKATEEMNNPISLFLLIVLCINVDALPLWDNFAKAETPKSSAGCPNTAYNSSDTSMVYSPNYPQDYGNNQQCVYVINAPERNVVHIHFTAFYTEFKRDKIEIFDGQISDDRLLGAHSGAEIPSDYYSTGNMMTLRFSSDPTYTYHGFAANCYSVLPSQNETDPTVQSV